jgi:hypothetical protein
MSSDENDLIKAEAARYKRATDAAAKSRDTLTKLVLAALREPDAKPAAIASRAEWTPAYVRKLARENGIEADPAYKARTEKAKARLLAEAGASQAPARPAAPAPMKFPARIFALIPDRAKAVALLAYERADDEQRPVLVAARQRAGQQNATASDRDRAVIAAAMKLDPPLVTEADLV